MDWLNLPLVIVLVAIGAIVLWIIDKARRQRCIACKLEVPRGATKCGHCGQQL